ncbi:MAG: DUF1992 domain-containing protein [Syntrophomonadaceae bacterium]|nr:DUF1992 domain-containing protein [Syntrophomonadaceae bacterium]
MPEKSIEEQIKTKAQKARKLAQYMSSTEDLVENQILKAQQEGKFNNLPGAGKPLDLQENPYEPPELRMVFKILKDNNFAPHWIELGKDIDSDLEKFWQEVDYFRRYTQMIWREKHTEDVIARYENKKKHFYYESRITLDKISKKIVDYNLHCPTFQLGRANISVEDEMAKVINIIENSIEQLRPK